MEYIKKGLSKPADWLLLGVVIWLTILVFCSRVVEKLDNIDEVYNAFNEDNTSSTANIDITNLDTTVKQTVNKISNILKTQSNMNDDIIKINKNLSNPVYYSIATGSNITTLTGQTYQDNRISTQINLGNSNEISSENEIKRSGNQLLNVTENNITCLVTYSGAAEIISGKGGQIRLRKNEIDTNMNSYLTNGHPTNMRYTLSGSAIVKLAPQDKIDFMWDSFDTNTSINLQNFNVSIIALK